VSGLHGFLEARGRASTPLSWGQFVASKMGSAIMVLSILMGRVKRAVRTCPGAS